MIRPRVFVRPDCPNASLLRHTVTKLGGELAHAEETPGISHIVCPFGPKGDPDDGQEYLRTMEVAGGAARVHWWYLPDSYDEWLPAAAAPPDVEPDLRPPGNRPWKIYVRFISDSEKYNEWMNEADYETEEAVAENKRAREAGEGDGEEVREKKRAKKATLAAEVAPGAVEAVGPGAALRRLLNPAPLALNPPRVEDISQGQRQEWAGAAVAPAPQGGTGAQAAVHRIPAKASWFSFRGINRIEMDEFSEFYDATSGKNSGQYREVRDHIIAKYREDPGRDLSLVEALRDLDVDANDGRKIYDFLVRWGIINWRPEGGHGGFAVDGGALPTGADALLRTKRAPTAIDAAEAAAAGSSKITVRPGTFKSAAPQAPAATTGVRYYCNVHPYEDCTEVRYHCTKLADIDICPAAYAEGRFPPGCSSKDFIRITANEAVPDASGWSDQETLLLLEGMELYGDDWGKVSEHVGGRSQLQCLQRLLQLPIEDALLPQPGTGGIELTKTLDTGADGEGQGGENGGKPAEIAGPLPFADVGNPVMAQVAFLTTMVGPRVAAAAAKRALEVLAEEDRAGIEGVDASDPSQQALPEARVRAAAAAGLAAAAVKARLMADAEEREMQRLVVVACENQLRRVNAKLAHLEKIDELIREEFAPAAQRTKEFQAELEKLKQEGEGNK